jgi:hypothetical protein
MIETISHIQFITIAGNAMWTIELAIFVTFASKRSDEGQITAIED